MVRLVLQDLIHPPGSVQDASCPRTTSPASAARIPTVLSHLSADGRHAWLHVLRGEIDLNGLRLAAGDGAAAHEASALMVRADRPFEGVLFDLA